MATRSDNATANMLLDKVGVANVNESMRTLGLRDSQISGQKLTTSPRDLLLLLEALALSRSPSQTAATEMVQLLLAQRVNDRIPAQLPRDTAVAHKTGNLAEVVHDAGIVYSPNATFVVVLLAEQVQNAGQVAQAEAALTRAVYDFFNGANNQRPRSALRAPNVAGRATAVPPITTPGALTTAASPAPATAATVPTVALVGTPGRSDAPTVAATPVVTAVRPTAVAPTAVAAATSTGQTPPGASTGQAPTAVRPTAVPPTAALPLPTEPARGPLPPTTAPAVAAPTAAVVPTAVPPVAAQPTAARLPDAPRFGPPTPIGP
jgi:hypothetical protein